MNFKTADVAGVRLFYREAGNLSYPTIVNYSIADVIGELARGRVPPGQASTAAVKPDVAREPEVLAGYEASCDRLLAEVAQHPDLRASGRYAHPWFGPLDAAGWHAMAGLHMGIHRAQVRQILS